jgi:hypothetical protein
MSIEGTTPTIVVRRPDGSMTAAPIGSPAKYSSAA